MIKVDYTDSDGIKRRVGLLSPHDAIEEGIPLDCFNELQDYYKELPESFRKNLLGRLWDMGLIEPQDFATREATQKYSQALKLAQKTDATEAIRFILSLSMESKTNGNSHK